MQPGCHALPRHGQHQTGVRAGHTSHPHKASAGSFNQQQTHRTEKTTPSFPRKTRHAAHKPPTRTGSFRCDARIQRGMKRRSRAGLRSWGYNKSAWGLGTSPVARHQFMAFLSVAFTVLSLFSEQLLLLQRLLVHHLSPKGERVFSGAAPTTNRLPHLKCL